MRYVTLPYEAHGYAGRETLLHVLAERINWFDKYMKNAREGRSRRPIELRTMVQRGVHCLRRPTSVRHLYFLESFWRFVLLDDADLKEYKLER